MKKILLVASQGLLSLTILAHGSSRNNIGRIPQTPIAHSLLRLSGELHPGQTAERPHSILPSYRGIAPSEQLAENFRKHDKVYRLPIGSLTEQVHSRIREQLHASAEELTHHDVSFLTNVDIEALSALRNIQARLDRGQIDPSKKFRWDNSRDSGGDDRPIRVGVYPTVGDPIHYGHFMKMLNAIASQGLDQGAFVLIDSVRKPNRTLANVRLENARKIAAIAAPFITVSAVALDNHDEGEPALLRLLGLNARRFVDAVYMFGDDHYSELNKHGNPDTLPALERLLKDSPIDQAYHKLSALVLQRDIINLDELIAREHVPTPIPIAMLPGPGIPSSSTDIRNGQLRLTPHITWESYRQSRRASP